MLQLTIIGEREEKRLLCDRRKQLATMIVKHCAKECLLWLYSWRNTHTHTHAHAHTYSIKQQLLRLKPKLLHARVELRLSFTQRQAPLATEGKKPQGTSGAKMAMCCMHCDRQSQHSTQRRVVVAFFFFLRYLFPVEPSSSCTQALSTLPATSTNSAGSWLMRRNGFPLHSVAHRAAGRTCRT